MGALALTYHAGSPQRFEHALAAGIELGFSDFMLAVEDHRAPLASLIQRVRDGGGHVRYLHLSTRPGSLEHLSAERGQQAFAALASPDEDERLRALEATLAMLEGLRASEVRTIALDPGPIFHPGVVELAWQIERCADLAPCPPELLADIQASHEAHAAQAMEAVCRSCFGLERKLAGSAQLAITTPASPLSWGLVEELGHVLDDGARASRGYWHRTCAAARLARMGVEEEAHWQNLFSKHLNGVSLADCVGLEGGQAPGLGDVDFKRIASGLARSTPQVLEMGPDASVTKLKFGCDVLRGCGLLVS